MDGSLYEVHCDLGLGGRLQVQARRDGSRRLEVLTDVPNGGGEPKRSLAGLRLEDEADQLRQHRVVRTFTSRSRTDLGRMRRDLSVRLSDWRTQVPVVQSGWRSSYRASDGRTQYHARKRRTAEMGS